MKKMFLLLFSFFSFGYVKNITVQTNHFIFHGKKKDLTEETKTFCENQYDKIVKKINKRPKNKIVTNIYPSLKAYQKAVKLKQKNDFNVGSIENNQIHIVSYYNPGSFHSAENIKAFLVSKIEKVILYSHFNLSKWLVEVIGFYERIQFLDAFEKQVYDDAFKRLLKDESKFKLSDVIYSNTIRNFEKISDLNVALQKTFENKALCISFIEFIINKWGYDFLLKLEKDKCVSSLFNMCINELETLWIEYAKGSC